MTDKKWLVIDAHSHYFPEEPIKNAVKRGMDLSNHMVGRIPKTIQKTKEIDTMVRIMEEGGVDMMVLYSSQWSPLGIETSREMNDIYAKLKKDYPGKFILCGQSPLKPGNDIIDEIERCISDLGFHGISFLASSPEFSVDSPELWPIYEKIAQLNVPVIIHPSIVRSLWGGGAKYDMRATVTREYEISKCVVEVLFGVLKDFPDLKFIFSHYGGGMPALKARVRAWFQPEGWPIPDDEECKNNGKSPMELKRFGLDKAFDELFDKLYFDMAGAGAGWTPMINAALAVLRTDHICFGTDYPFDVRVPEDIRYFIDAIKNLNIPEQDKRLMLGENIQKLFKLN